MTARPQVELPVIRYKPSGYSVGMRADGEGRYVDYFDYAALATRLAESEARAEDSKRLDWLIDNHANVETDGHGNWRVVIEWTSPETYFPYAQTPYLAIDAAIAQEAEREAASAATRC